MSNDKNNLTVYLNQNAIATITINDSQLEWNYEKSWQNFGYSLSPYLPLQDHIPSYQIQNFLRNLLPEGNGFEMLLNVFHLSRMNTFGLINALGSDLPGALIIVPQNQSLPRKGKFQKIKDEEITSHLNNRDNFNIFIWDGKPRLSVAGIQDKINVVIDPKQNIGFGEGALCSTHILKFEKQKLSHLVLNETLSMYLGAQCGLNVAACNLCRFDDHNTLLVKRFDRQFISVNEVKRRHIIDGCQALNLPPEYKYERNFGSGRDVAHIRDGASFKKLFDLCKICINPVRSTQTIVDWALFNLLIFNSDAHGKNISYFVNANGLQLAPFYDLVNIRMYPEFNQEMAMAFGDEFNINEIYSYQLADFAEQCNLPRKFIITRLKLMIKKLILALQTDLEKFAINNEEVNYISQYKSIVKAQCEHLREQADNVLSVCL